MPANTGWPLLLYTRLLQKIIKLKGPPEAGSYLYMLLISMRLKLFFTSLLILCLFTVKAQQKNLSIAPTPSWLVPYQPDMEKKPDARDISDGYYLLLFEEQHHVEKEAVYYHIVRQIVSEAGIQNGAEISVTYDPSYEKVHFHKIIIRRNGQEINQLQPSRFKFLQQEEDLSRFIYSGVYTAYFLLEDVRKGDQIEYAYTTEGNNPIFDKKFSTFFYLTAYDPVVNFYKSLIASPTRNIRFKSFNNARLPARETLNGMQVYEWKETNIKPLESTTLTPGWYFDYPLVQASEYNDWQEVINWGARVNTVQAPGAGLRKKITELKSEAGDNKASYMLKAIRFVQDDIRYMGIEMGEYSHRPNTPDKILLQRFGDCKDKSQLLTQLLKANGIFASMVYINTYRKGHVADYLPTPDIFNHVIVYAQLDGKDYWIDPTISYQRGDLSHLTVPDYQKGLIVNPEGTKGFTDISGKSYGKVSVVEHFYLPMEKDNKGSLEVTSTYQRRFADYQRDELANSSLKDNEKAFMDYYRKVYGKISVDTPLQVNDIDTANKLVMRETYILEEPWKKDSTANGRVTFSPFAGVLKDLLPATFDKERKDAPLALRYPVSMDYSIVVEMPSEWPVDGEVINIKNKYYAFYFSPSTSGSTATLRYKFETFQDHIPADYIATYLEDRKKIDEVLGYNFYWNPDSTASSASSGGLNWMIIGLTVLFAGIFYYQAQRYYKKSILPVQQPLHPGEINGWLALLAIGICIRPLMLLVDFFKTPVLKNSLWQNLDQVKNATGNTSLLQLLLIIELAGNVFFITYSILLVFLFFKKRDIFPRSMVYYFILNFVFLLADHIAFYYIYQSSSWDPEATKSLIQLFVAGAVWSPYLLRSEQVKETFIMPHDSKLNEY